MATLATEKPSQRIVPSGKVYRQMFEAEAQLVKALEGKSQNKTEKLEKKETNNNAPEIPLVRVTPASKKAGILTCRQKDWVVGFPNEPHVENPVIYKFESQEQKARTLEPVSLVASREVRGLPDIVTPAKKGSDINERIQESRRQRHEASLEDMHQALGLISSEMEPRIEEAGQSLIETLQENDKTIENMKTVIEKDQDLVEFTQDELYALWEQLASQSGYRQDFIKDLDVTLVKVEEDRIDGVRDVFQKYAADLGKIAHLMQPDLQRLLDKEAQFFK